jgi:dihydroorotase
MHINHVRLASDLAAGPVDVRIEGGVIASITPSVANAPAIDVLLPGLVDLHTHLREPGGEEAEDIASGTAAAAAGGYTDVFAMPNTIPATDSVDAVRDIRARAADTPARVHVIGATTVGRAGTRVVDVDAMASAGVVLFSDDGSCVADDDVARTALTAMQRVGGILAQHAQHPGLVGDGVVNARVAARIGAAGWPVDGETSIIARDIELVRQTGGALHVCHVSTAASAALIRTAKVEGLPVTAEVTPHHLVLSDDDAAARGPALKVNPPLRAPEDIEALRQALRDGTIDVVGTDHAPHPARTKSKPWPDAAFGLTALETAVAAVAEALTDADGVTDWGRVALAMAVNPARIGRLPGERALRVGAPADLCVVRSERWTVKAEIRVGRSTNTPFAGHAFGHRVITTLRDGIETYTAR